MQSYIEPLQNAVLQIVFLNSLCRLIGDNEPWDWIWKCRWASVIESPTSRKLSLSNFFSPLKVRSTSNLAKLKGKHFHKKQQEKKVCALYVEYFDIEGLPYILIQSGPPRLNITRLRVVSLDCQKNFCHKGKRVNFQTKNSIAGFYIWRLYLTKSGSGALPFPHFLLPHCQQWSSSAVKERAKKRSLFK